MLVLLGGSPDAAAASARAVLAIETTLAGASLDAVSRRNPKNVFHPMPVASLQTLMPAFDWTAFLAAMAVPPFETIDVLQPEYLKAVNTLVAEAPIADLQAYFRWHMLHASVVMLPAAFRQADFEFFGRALRGQKAPPPRWRECVAETTRTSAKRSARRSWRKPSRRGPRAMRSRWPAAFSRQWRATST